MKNNIYKEIREQCIKDVPSKCIIITHNKNDLLNIADKLKNIDNDLHFSKSMGYILLRNKIYPVALVIDCFHVSNDRNVFKLRYLISEDGTISWIKNFYSECVYASYYNIKYIDTNIFLVNDDIHKIESDFDSIIDEI